MEFLVKELSFINHRLVQPGEVVEMDVPKDFKCGDNLEPVVKPETKKSNG